MKKYERRVSLKTLLLLFIRRYEFIAIFLIPSVVASLIISQVVNKKTYSSSVSLQYYGSVITANNYKIVRDVVLSSGTISMTAKNLKENKIVHSNGNEISETDILNGISVTDYATNSIYFTFSYESTDKSVTDLVLDELTEMTLYSLKKDPSTKLGGMTVAVPVSEPKANDKNRKTLILGLGVGVLASLASAFIAEIILDEVYDKSDVELFGGTAYEISLPNKGKEE